MPSAAEILQFFGMRGQTSPEDSLGAAEFWNQYKGRPAQPIPSTPGEPTIQARQPNLMDRIGYALQGDQRASLGQQRAIANIKGLADMTPLAALDAKGPQEAALAILPGAGGPMGKEAMAAAKAGIRAYHGSPHSFERFELSPKTIGSGEGAQAYGHGLYFAENEGVAKGYRDTLAQSRSGVKFNWNGQEISKGDAAQNIANNLKIDSPSTSRPYNIADMITTWTHNGLDADAIRGAITKGGFDKVMESNLLRGLDIAQKNNMVRSPGHMYEVNINAKPERFLDWDKPLARQTSDVMGALERVPSIAPEYLKSERLTGGQLAPQTMQGVEQLREAGIPGIKFLDQGSRGAGQGTSNYVVFDDKLIDILRKYGLAGMGMLGAGGAAYDSAQTPRY
jgi:hypothetical protein